MNAHENQTSTANTNAINFVAAKAKSRVRCRLIFSLIYRISIFPKNLVNQLKGPSLSITDTAHDDLVRIALERDLVPVGNIPKYGSCLFHYVAQSLSSQLQTDLGQLDIRNVVNLLSEDPETPDGDRFFPFIPNLHWDTYLEGI